MRYKCIVTVCEPDVLLMTKNLPLVAVRFIADDASPKPEPTFAVKNGFGATLNIPVGKLMSL